LDVKEFTEKKEVEYKGLSDSLELLRKIGKENKIEAIFAFSQGSLLTLLLSILVEFENEYKEIFKELKCIILCAGFLDPYPNNKEILDKKEIIQSFLNRGIQQEKGNISENNLNDHFHSYYNEMYLIKIPIMNIYGELDDIIIKEKSKNIEKLFKSVESFHHPGKHFIPSSKAEIEKYVTFLNKYLKE